MQLYYTYKKYLSSNLVSCSYEDFILFGHYLKICIKNHLEVHVLLLSAYLGSHIHLVDLILFDLQIGVAEVLYMPAELCMSTDVRLIA